MRCSFQARNLPMRNAILAGAALLLLACPAPTYGATIYGTLSNFDVYNDTGQVSRGFEIELPGLSSIDVTYSFASPNIRYQTPTIVPTGGGIIVRYAAQYDAVNHVFLQGTPIPAVVSPTLGHQCWTGGDPAGYPTAGCEHFGLALAGNPAGPVGYRWLLGDSATGTLTPIGTNVNIPAPIWNVIPPPVPGPPPVVQAVVPAPAEDAPVPGALFGEAQYVKVFFTEQPSPVDLGDLVPGGAAVPGEAEVETEWFLLQRGKNGGLNDELDSQADLGAGANSVVRRYEYYKYTSTYYDSEGEALCENPSVAGCEGSLGDYIGSQMAAANLIPAPVPAPVPEPSSMVLIGGGLLIVGLALRRLKPSLHTWSGSRSQPASVPPV